MFSYVILEDRIPKSHSLRKLRFLVDTVLATMDREFEAVYAKTGRPSVPPERLLKAMLLQILFTIRSERLLVESIDYNLLYRWFVGLAIDDPVWDQSTFSQNRDRLFNEGLAWLYKKSEGTASRLCHMSHLLMENRTGLVVDVASIEANGKAERQAALKFLAKHVKRGATVGADKGYDTAGFVAGCRKLGVTPRVARKKTCSAIDGRTTRHAGYRTSLKVRKRIEEAFGWLKTVGGLRKTRLIGQAKLAGQALLSVATSNLVRMGSLSGWWNAQHV